MGVPERALAGARHELRPSDAAFPQALRCVSTPPERLYVVGDPDALQEGLAIVGARKATPYGLTCAARFARLAAERGIVIISGGARGCDAASHRAALEAGGRTVAFLGGGCDRIYPAEHFGLFQAIVDSGGAVVSERDWGFPPMPYAFRARNRLIAGLARATLIVEAGLPSGTFSTADEALAANREVLAVPGAITSVASLGANRLIYQGATPITDDDTFYDQLFSIFGCLKQEQMGSGESAPAEGHEDWLSDALAAQPLAIEELFDIGKAAEGDGLTLAALMMRLTDMTARGMASRYPDGRYGPALHDEPMLRRDAR